MASILYGALVRDLAGRIGGQNVQRGLASPIIRNISTRRNFQSVTPVGNKIPSIRGLFLYVVKSWRNLSPTEQAAWVAITASFPRINKFGNTYTPSAYQLFVELSLGLVYTGRDIVTGAPSVSTFPASNYTVVYNNILNIVVVTQTPTYAANPYQTVIKCSTYLSNGRGFSKSGLRVLTLHQFTSASPTLDISSLIVGMYGSYIAGTTMFFELYFINITTGEEANYSSYSVQF